MRKFFVSLFVFACFVGIGGEVLAACGVKSMKMSGVQYKYDDEFLYENKDTYNKVGDANGEYTGLPGNVYECDNEHCASGVARYMPAGHVFKGSVVNVGKTYECKANFMGDDRWVEKSFGATCGEVHMSFDGNQTPADNEFLYSTHEAYLEANRKWRNDSLDLSGVGEVFECDDDHCKRGTIKKMTKGHSFGGQKINEDVTYECKLNRWVRVGAESCQFAGVNIAVDEWYTDTAGTKIPVSYNDCHQFADGNPANKNDMFNVKCERINGLLKNVCHKIGADDDKKPDDKKSECAEYISDFNLFQQCSFCHREKESGAFWDSKSKICRCIGEVNKNKEWNAEQGKCVVKENDSKLKKCLQERQTEEGKACCYLEPSVATFKNGKCVCSGGKTFRMDMNGQGICTGGNGGDDLIPKEECVSLFAELKTLVKTQCVTLQTQLNTLIQMCESGILKGEYFSQQVVEIQRKCDAEEQRNNNLAKQKLVDAGKKLDDLFAGFKVSKWKDAEGKFNTARLASDSIAGVVLGTTGGLITSSVMKKKQTEQGFEDLQCVVGGQPVAGWGDEFMVGIQ